jgi:hypothetical protein
MSAAPKTVPVSAALLDSLEDRLCDVSEAIAAVAETLNSMSDVSHLKFVSNALMGALAEKAGNCFEVLSHGRLLKAEREMVEAAHAKSA